MSGLDVLANVAGWAGAAELFLLAIGVCLALLAGISRLILGPWQRRQARRIGSVRITKADLESDRTDSELAQFVLAEIRRARDRA